MRDRRDYLIAALAAALLFCLGLELGQVSVLSEAKAQGTNGGNGAGGNGPAPTQADQSGGGLTITPPAPQGRTGLEGRTSALRPSDSDSNNRFVAVTCPTVSGESVLFLVDSVAEQVAVYRYRWGQGLEFLSGRKIEYDLKVSGYRDVSELSFDQMREAYQKEVARQAAKAAGK
jgi:hypothetical protein